MTGDAPAWPAPPAEVVDRVAALGLLSEEVVAALRTDPDRPIGDDGMLRYGFQLVVLALTGQEMPPELLESFERVGEVVDILNLYGGRA